MKKRNFLVALPAVIFCGFILLMAVLYFVLPKEEYSPREKQQLAPFPEWSAQSFAQGEFQDKLDTYLSDHVAARTFFTGIQAGYDLLTGRNGSRGIYLGKDGYLFPKPTKDSDILAQNARYIREFADTAEIPVYMTLIPSSGFVNASRLPAVHETYRDGELIDAFRQNIGQKITFTDVTADFLQMAQTESLYYRTDHHWTSAGAYTCYRLLGDDMGYTPLPESDFTVETVGGFYGTSYAKSALWGIPSENIELWHKKDQAPGSVRVEIDDGEGIVTSEDYFFRDRLNDEDKYPVFLDGNHSMVRVTNAEAPEGTLLVVKDSYAHALVPFLSRHYREIVMVDLRYYKQEISALAAQENADAVLMLYSLKNMATDTNLAYLY